LPRAAAPLAYGAGVLVTPGMLHGSGIAIGLVNKWPVGAKLVRVCGMVVAAVGVYFLVQALS
jgi:urease accessory protein